MVDELIETLKNGDEVSIDGIRYTVANLVTDTSFEFTATTMPPEDESRFVAIKAREVTVNSF